MLVMAAVISQTMLWMVALAAIVAALKLLPSKAWKGGPLALALSGLAVLVLVAS